MAASHRKPNWITRVGRKLKQEPNRELVADGVAFVLSLVIAWQLWRSRDE